MAAQSDIRVELLTLARTHDFAGLFARCSELENAQSSGMVLDPSFYLQYLFSCLFLGNLVQARFLWKRLPSEFKSDHELTSAWAVGKALIKRKYPDVYRHLDTGRWRMAEDLAQLFRAQFVERMTQLVAKAYSSLRVQQAAAMLGMTPANVTSFATSKGWTVTGDIIRPKAEEGGAAKQVKAQEVERVTRMLNFLEQKEHAF